MKTKKTDTTKAVAQANTAPVESNCLIAPESDTPPLPPGKVLPAGTKVGGQLSVAYIENKLRAHYRHWEAGVGEAHERLYQFLGWVYEWAPKVKANLYLAGDIAARAKQLHGKSRSANSASGEELLLILTLGFGKAANSNRCNWLRALRAADQAGVPRNASSCGEWFRDQGGMKAAGALYRAEPKTPQAKFDPVEYMASLAGSSSSTVMQVGGGLELDDGTHVILVNSTRDADGEMKFSLLAHLEDPETLGLVAKAHMLRAKKLDGLLWDLNRYALKAAGHPFAGKISPQDLKAFAAATVVLLADPEWRQRFFTEDAEPIVLASEVTKNDRLPFANSSYGIHDPGRYIPGANQAALLPYEPDLKAWDKMSKLERYESRSPQYIQKHSKKSIGWPDEKTLGSLIYDERLAEQKRRNREHELEDARSKQLEDV